MDEDLLVKGIKDAKDGKLDIAMLLKIALKFEVMSAQVGAIAQCVVDGTLYTKDEKRGRDEVIIGELKHFAELHYVLRTIKDASKEIGKLAERALSGTDERAGNDGHTQRFAERLRETGLSKFRIDDLGSFFIKSQNIVLPPSKKGQDIAIDSFIALMKKSKMDIDDPKVTLAEANAVAAKEKVKIPPYLAFKLYLRQVGLAQESWNWGALQKHAQTVSDAGEELPEFLKVSKREEVQFRRA